MNPNILQVKCPWCSAILSVQYQPGIESKSLLCPVCKQKRPFVDFKHFGPAIKKTSDSNEATKLPNIKKKEWDEETEMKATMMNNQKGNTTIGYLRDAGTGIIYRLKHGRNVIGRKSSKSIADIMISIDDSRKTSREHLIIEVKNMPSKGIVHFVSLYKEKVNPTFVGSDQLFFGDSVVLNNGDKIILPDTTLCFMIPDEDETELGT